MGFCKEFNAKTKDQSGMILPVEITVYADRSFSFILKSPPASVLLKKAAGLAKGSGVPNRDKVGKVTLNRYLKLLKLNKMISMPMMKMLHVELSKELLEAWVLKFPKYFQT